MKVSPKSGMLRLSKSRENEVGGSPHWFRCCYASASPNGQAVWSDSLPLMPMQK